MIKNLFVLAPVFVLVAVVSGATYIFLSPIVVSAIPQLTTPIPMLQSITDQIQAAWSTVPSTIQGIITLAIPSSFALFFAWTKSRAMNKLQQTQQQATEQFSSLQGETVEAKSKLTDALIKNEALTKQVSTYEQAQTNAAQLTKQLETQKIQMEKLTGERNQMQRLFESKYLKPPEKPKLK